MPMARRRWSRRRRRNSLPDLRPALAAASAYVENYNREKGRFLDAFLDRHYQALAGEHLERFRTSVDIMVGRKKRYDSQSVAVPLSAPRADRVLRSQRVSVA